MPNGTFVVRVEATDKDIGTNGIIRYSLDPLPRYHGLFRIDERTGEVWTNAVLDYEEEQGSKYVLSVSAKDLGPDSIPSKASITVEVRVFLNDFRSNLPFKKAQFDLFWRCRQRFKLPLGPFCYLVKGYSCRS